MQSEYYDATLECIGIPTDFPVGAYIKVKPVVFQSMSRTAGRYFIVGADDSISTSGIFTTTIQLHRVDTISGVETVQIQAGTSTTVGGEMIVRMN